VRVRWTDIGKGQSAPLLTVGLRRNGLMMLTNPLLLVDTGADGTVLPRYSAALLGFKDADLIPETCTVAGGTITVKRPVDVAGTEIEIGGVWRTLPSLKFAEQILFPLLGRDVIFAHYDLTMSGSHFELRPKK
jgi:hypothetical protein